MTPLYLWAKFCKKVRGSALVNCRIHKTAKIEAGSNAVNCSMGRYSFCGYDCTLINCDIGSFCSIANRVVIGGARHPMEWVSMSPVFSSGRDSVNKKYSCHAKQATPKTWIGNDVWIGETALIKAGTKVGDGAVIGMGSVVTKDVPPYAIVGGCPAKIIRQRFSEETILKLLNMKWWDFDEERLNKYAAYITDPERFVLEVEKG
jgi:acetyltransferase-like isoleucine patch superfamily enzyme